MYEIGEIANFAVRRFLADVSVALKKEVLTRDSIKKKQRKLWGEIKARFGNSCAFCGRRETGNKPLQIDHLVPINRESCGLPVPSNSIPCCSDCNGRRGPRDWVAYLRECCGSDSRTFKKRRERITSHSASYPKLTRNQLRIVSSHAAKLYEAIKNDIKRATKQCKEGLLEAGAATRRHR